MTDPIHETDHADFAYDQLLWQYQSDNQPIIEAVLRALIDALQTAENLAWQVLTETKLSAYGTDGPAVGVQLDVIGELLGDPRSDRDDDTYRSHLKARGIVLRSLGRIAELNAILSAIVYAWFRVSDFGGGAVVAWIADATYEEITARYLGEARAGGVCLDLIWSRDVYDETLHFGETLADAADPDVGPGSTTDSSIGGSAAGVIRT